MSQVSTFFYAKMLKHQIMNKTVPQKAIKWNLPRQYQRHHNPSIDYPIVFIVSSKNNKDRRQPWPWRVGARWGFIGCCVTKCVHCTKTLLMISWRKGAEAEVTTEDGAKKSKKRKEKEKTISSFLQIIEHCRTLTVLKGRLILLCLIHFGCIWCVLP